MIAYILRRSGSFAALRTAHPLGHAIRALTGLASLSLFFYAYTQMPLANVIAISFAAPLLVTALAVPLLGERVGWRRWSAILFGFASPTEAACSHISGPSGRARPAQPSLSGNLSPSSLPCARRRAPGQRQVLAARAIRRAGARSVGQGPGAGLLPRPR